MSVSDWHSKHGWLAHCYAISLECFRRTSIGPYIARQFNLITLPMLLFCFTVGRNYVNFSRSPLTLCKRPLVTIWHIFMVDYHFCPVPVSHLFNNRIQFWVVTLCKITNSNLSDNHANQYPACIYRNNCSALRSRAFSEGDVENYWRVTRCHLKRPASCSWHQQFYRGDRWSIDCRRPHQRRLCPFPCHEE